MTFISSNKNLQTIALQNQKQAENYLSQGQIEQAIACYQKVIKFQPEHWEIYQKLGDIYLQQEQFSEAITLYQNAIKLNPNFSWFHHKLGEALIKLQQWEKAVTSYQRAIELNPDFSWSYQKLGETFIQLSKWDLAATALRQAIKLNPEFYLSYEKLGEALTNQNNLHEAVTAYQKAIEINPNSYWSHNKFGEILIRLGKLEEAEIVLQKAVEINPKIYFAHHNLGEVFFKQEKEKKAITKYHQAIEINPNSYWSHNSLGDALAKLENWSESITAYRCAIEINPNYYWSYNSLGNVLLQIGQSEEAITCYIKAIKLKPNATGAYEKLRGIYIHKLAKITLNQLNELVKCYQETIQLQPNFPEAYINLADILTEKDELDTAINYYQKATYNKLLVSHPKFAKNYWNYQQLSQPNFIIIGTVKGGTSSLYNYLCRHPNIIPALHKEINFFSKKFHKGIDWYLAHFPQLPEQTKFITGEATPNYMYSDEVRKKLLDNFPKVKIIAILRNPIDRAISHFYMAKRLGKESKEFTEFVPQEIKVLTQLNNNPQNYQRLIDKMSSYFRASLYIHFLKKWINLFPKEQLLILKSEDMYENPAATTKQVFDFLGLPDYQLLEYKNYFPGSYTSIDFSLRCQLSELFQPHNQKLEEYLGRKFNWN